MRERRRDIRIKLNIPIALKGHQQCDIRGNVTDISLRGLKVHVSEKRSFLKGDIFQFKFTSPVHGVELLLEGRAEVIWAYAKVIGMHFIDMEPETVEHLRYLVEVNGGNPDPIK